ncbi:MAG: adenylate/guanylate cyclase domain-containing protein, partial [Bdellovibrionales bacterium]|nr:adenylate/guanylate cyclase domain-containing protein [Bdellovibrionales bacterium]
GFPAQLAPQEVVLVLFDQQSINELETTEGLVFPFPRQLMGAVASVAGKVKSKAVVYDIIFSEASSHGVDDDETFASMLKDSGVSIFMPAASSQGSVKPPFNRIMKSEPQLGAVHYNNEIDGVYRRIPSQLEDSNNTVTMPQLVVESVYVDKVKAVEDRPWLKNYESESFQKIPFYNFLLAYRKIQDGEELPEDFRDLKDKILIVGYSAPGLHDLKPLSTDPLAMGAEVLATGISNRIDNSGLMSLSKTSYLMLLIIMSFLFILLPSLFKAPGLSLAVFYIALSADVIILTSIMWAFGNWMNPIPLFFGIFLGGTLRILWIFKTQWQERLRMAKSLENSMSPEMLKLISNGDIDISRFGKNKEISIFFCDLSGFTTLSEKLSAEELVEILNSYLDKVVDLIIDKQGYVDKFIGDAVMALWGAPIDQEHHAG